MAFDSARISSPAASPAPHSFSDERDAPRATAAVSVAPGAVRWRVRRPAVIAAIATLLFSSGAAADLIRIDRAGFSGYETLVTFDLPSTGLPYSEGDVTFAYVPDPGQTGGPTSYVGGNLFFAGNGTLQVRFKRPVGRIGFSWLGTWTSSMTATAYADPELRSLEPVGVVEFPSGSIDGRQFIGLEADTPFTRLDLAISGPGQMPSFLIDDFRFELGEMPDNDGDQLPDYFERRFGLSPDSAVGANGASGDPDADGATNLSEYYAGTHPRALFTRYFAEGATGSFFDTQIALVNPGGTGSAHVLLRYLTRTGTAANEPMTVEPMSRHTATPERVPGTETAEFSAVVESDVPIVADRTMTWDARGYGSHAETSIAEMSSRWYFAEGSTTGGFQLFYLLQNTHPDPAHVMVEYLLPPPRVPLVRLYTVPPHSRYNIWVNFEDGLTSTDVSATVSSDLPIIAERAMYLDRPGQGFAAGHGAAAIRDPSTHWFLAEGATGDYFDTFVLVANPGEQTASILATFLKPDGSTVEKQFDVPGRSRWTTWVDYADPALADTAVSATVVSTNDVPVLVERAMWWPGPTPETWFEAHCSAGMTDTGTTWALAEGEQGGARETETYILIANTSPFEGLARVTLLVEDGRPLEKTVPLPANSRTNVQVDAPEDRGGFGTALNGKRFGAIVESLPGAATSPAQIVVERAMYSNTQFTRWAAGTNAVATKLR